MKHRQAGVEDSRVIRHAVLPVGRTFGEIPAQTPPKNQRPAGRRLDIRTQQLTRGTRIQDRAEQLPVLAIKPLQPELLVDAVVGRRGVDFDPG